MTVAFLFQRKARDAHTLQLVGWVNLMQFMCASLFMIGSRTAFVLPTPAAWCWIAAMCGLSFVYLLLLSVGSKFLTATVTGFVFSLEPVFAIGAQVLVFQSMVGEMEL